MSVKLGQIAEFLKKQAFNFKVVEDRFIVTRIATDGPSLEQVIECSEHPNRIALHTVIQSSFKNEDVPRVLELASRAARYTRFARAHFDLEERILTVQVYMLTTHSTFNKRQFFELQSESESAGAFVSSALGFMLLNGLSPEAALEKSYETYCGSVDSVDHRKAA